MAVTAWGRPIGMMPLRVYGAFHPMAQEAFGSFTHYGESSDKGSWLSSLAASAGIYVVLGCWSSASR